MIGRAPPSPAPRAARWSGAIALAWLAACQVNPATAPPPTATEVPPLAQPTAPPSPTVRIVMPTATLPAPTAAPTATPPASPTPLTVEATPDPNLGVGELIYADAFDGAGWTWALADNAATFSLARGQLNAVMSSSGLGWRIAPGPGLTVGDQQIRLTTRTSLCYELDEYGLLFRGLSSQTGAAFSGYLFKLSCAGRARVEVLRANEVSVLLDWTALPAIVPGAPAENALTVWAAKGQLHFFVNDKHLGSAFDTTYPSGGYGLFLRDRTSGGLAVGFDDLFVRAVQAP